MFLKYFCAWLLQFWNDQTNTQWLHVFWTFSFWPGALFGCLQQTRPRQLHKSQSSTWKHCMLASHRFPAKGIALLGMLSYKTYIKEIFLNSMHFHHANEFSGLLASLIESHSWTEVKKYYFAAAKCFKTTN